MEQMNRPKVGVGVLIRNDDKILLLQRKSAQGDDGTWAPPGGHLEMGESIIECAKREALEEVNVTIENEQIVTITEDIFDAQKHYITIWVMADYAGGEVTNNEPEKCADVCWFLSEELPENLFLPFQNLIKQQES